MKVFVHRDDLKKTSTVTEKQRNPDSGHLEYLQCSATLLQFAKPEGNLGR